MIDKEKVGRAISEQRKIKNMTQRQLASLLNVSFQAVSRWEQGICLPSVDLIYDIAKIFETTVDFLLSGLPKERRVISYMDSGLDAQRIHVVKNKLYDLVGKNEVLLHAQNVDPVFFRPEITKMEEPVCVFANHVPGSKERFAMENGYDREICIDLVSNAANNLIRFGVKPEILQANMVCGNNDSNQILLMGKALKEACEISRIVFAGLEVAAQAVNYSPKEYKTSALVFGTVDREKIITGEQITEGDVIIGLRTEGISSISYPFIKVIIDRKPDIINTKIDGHNIFMDELMKPNASFVNAIDELNKHNLVHGVFSIDRSLFNNRCYNTMPKGLGACISVSSIPLSALFQYIYDLKMMDRECFLENFSLGISMLLAVPKKQCAKAISIIEKYHNCYIIGKIEKNNSHPDSKVWMAEPAKL